MSQAWIDAELATVNFGDTRLNKRFIGMLEALANSPNASIPQAMGGKAELDAAYRLFDNDKVTDQKILQPHIDATIQRCQSEKIVLVAQDTTEIDMSRPKQQVAGAGPLDGASRRGAFLHSNQAFTPGGIPLGTLSAQMWARPEPDANATSLSKSEKEKKRRETPFEKRESYRWFAGMQNIQNIAAAHPDTHFISLNDSEGDMAELITMASSDNFDWIIRSCHDRQTILDDEEENKIIGKLRDPLRGLEILFTSVI
jgi:hypothetical protein